MTGCPGHDTVAAYVDGALADGAVTAFEAHVDHCDDCRRHVSTLARLPASHSFLADPTEPTSAVAPHGSRELGPGTQIGRLVVLGALGRGGMGQVVEAYDPKLERHVAVKVLDPARWQGAGSQARERLQREAVVMARLAHPNVVMVFDVGTWGEQLYVAMELIRGSTLDAWVRHANPRPREVLEACIAAGRGLAAAHAAGVIHRDFKPGNVLRATDGRVRVTDFGLAALADEASTPAPVTGTPGYMSPEQMAGAVFDDTSDQFSFCVTTWEMLSGTRPFAGTSIAELREAVRERPGVAAGITPAVRRVLLRGLAEARAARYPSMDALLAALTSAAHLRSRRVRVVAGLASLLTVGAMTYGFVARGPSEDVCGGAEQQLVGVWDAPRRAAVRAAFVASGDASGFDRFAAVLDDRTGRWVAARHETCRATVRAEQSPQLRDARMQCLDEQLGGVRALIDVVGQPGKPSLSRAIDAAHTLPEPVMCSTASVEARGQPIKFREPFATWAAQLDRLLELAPVQIDMLDLSAADVLLLQAERMIPVVPDPVREARAAFYRGLYLIATHDPDKASDALTRAVVLAANAGNHRIVAAAAVNMVRLLTNNTRRFAEGVAWETMLEVELARGGDDDLRADLEESHAVIAWNRDDYKASRDHALRALELYERLRGHETPSAIGPLQRAAEATTKLEGRAAAEPLYRRALAIAEQAYGPEHPLVATTLAMSVAYKPGAPKAEIEAARVTLERVLAIRERAYGPAHPMVVDALMRLAAVALDLGDFVHAQAYLERDLAIEESAGDAREIVHCLTGLAAVYKKQGRIDDTRRMLVRSVDTIDRAEGPTSPDLLSPLIQLADVELESRGCKAAAPVLERAYLVTGKHSADSMKTSYVLLQLATCELEAGKASRALELARIAHELRTSAKLPPPLLAESGFTVAQALERTGKRADAIAAAELAEPQANPSFRAEMQPWLTSVRAGRRPLLVK